MKLFIYIFSTDNFKQQQHREQYSAVCVRLAELNSVQSNHSKGNKQPLVVQRCIIASDIGGLFNYCFQKLSWLAIVL